MGHPEGPPLSLLELREALGSADPRRRATAVERAREETGIEQALIGALADADATVRRAAVRRLAELAGPRTAGALIEVSVGDLSVSVRAEAVAAIGRLLESRMAGRRGEGNEPPA